MTLAEAHAVGRAALSAGDGAEAARDARLLLAAAAGLDMAALVAQSGEELSAVARRRYNTYLSMRAAGEPVARIVGSAEFWGLRFALSAATLVPRPDTETLVETVLDEARRRFPATVTICDLGTGSGAIAIALLTELPEASAVATDISAAALDTARANAERHGVGDRVRFERIDFADGPDGPFDLVVSNPPYVRSRDIGGLAVEVREHDPRLALDGGKDGLASYRAILSRAGRLLAREGVLAFEVGHDQGEAVAALCHQAGFSEVRIRADLGGRGRVVTASETMSGSNLKAAKKALGKVQ